MVELWVWAGESLPAWDHPVQLSASPLHLATYLMCCPVLPTSEVCLASQDPGIMGWIGWLSNSLGAEEETKGKLISTQTVDLLDHSTCPACLGPFCLQESLCLLFSEDEEHSRPCPLAIKSPLSLVSTLAEINYGSLGI